MDRPLFGRGVPAPRAIQPWQDRNQTPPAAIQGGTGGTGAGQIGWDSGAQQQPPMSPSTALALGEPPIPAEPTVNVSPFGGSRGLGTVQRELQSMAMPLAETWLFNFAQKADDAPAWGTRARDLYMRRFWVDEPFIAGAVVATSMRYSNYAYTLRGPSDITDIISANLQGSDRGAGWNQMMFKFCIDALTQDNGAFMEIVRTADDPLAPFVTLNHLDSSRCIATGRWAEPVIYQDIFGAWHKMAWHQIIRWVEVPSPVEASFGKGYCAVGRIMKMAQIMRDFLVYNREKIGGRFNKAVHLVGGVQRQVIDDTLRSHAADADNRQLLHYMQPAIVASLDPNAKVSVATIELAGLPENFDYDKWFKWYITAVALNLGGDYQDIAPLPTGNLGSSQGGGRLLHTKSQGKGSENYTNFMQHTMNYRGIMPTSVKFSISEADQMEEMTNVELKKERSQDRQIRIMSGEISPELARLEAVAAGDLDPDLLAKAGPQPDIMPGSFPGGPPADPNAVKQKTGQKQPPSNDKSGGSNATAAARGNGQRSPSAARSS